MARRMTDDFIDDVPTVTTQDEVDDADGAFWDEFLLKEQDRALNEGRFTITIKDELTGEEKVIKNLKLKDLKKSKLN